MGIEACEKCRFFKQSNTWNISIESQENPQILIVDSYPNRMEDRTGAIFSSHTKSAKPFRTLLSALETPYAIASAMGCYPVFEGTEVKKPKDQEITHCSDNFLQVWIQKHKPKVIICLGGVAMKAVLREHAPKTMSPILNSAVKLNPKDPNSADVIVVNHPSIYHIKDPESQQMQHINMLCFADDICKGLIKKAVVTYTEITTPRQVLEIERTLGPELYFDIEHTGSKYDKRRATHYSPDARMICFSLTDNSLGYRRVFSFHGAILKRPDILIKLFQNRIIKAHNVFADYYGFLVYTGINLFKVCKKVLCTFAARFLSNQNGMGNSLKKLAGDLGAYDWSTSGQKDIAEANQHISEAHSYLNRRTARVLRLFKNNRASKKDLLQFVQIAKQRKQLRPRKSADYADIKEILPYNAEDTYQLSEVDEKIIKPLWDQGKVPQPAYDICMNAIELLTYIQNNGLDINPKRFKILKKAIADRYHLLQDKLIRNPIVQVALYAAKPNLVDQLKKVNPQKARAIIRKEISPKAYLLLANIAKLTGVEELCVPSFKKKTRGNKADPNRLCFDIEVMLNLSGGFPDTELLQRNKYWTPHEEKTQEQLLWYTILILRKFFDLKTKFIKEYDFYMINGKIRTNYVLFKSEAYGSGMGKDSATGTGTGRVASRHPNVQQIKKEYSLRWVFDPGQDYRYAEMDYKSIEPMILALVTGCSLFLEAFNRDLDIYRMIANEVYGLGIDTTLPDDQVRQLLNDENIISKTLRDLCKTSTLAIMYGESPKAFASRTKLDLNEVLDFYSKFDRIFPEIKDQKQIVNELIERGEPVVTWTGRRKIYELPRCEDPKEYNRRLAKMQRQAFNFLIQSLANDIMLIQGYEVFKYIQSKGKTFQENVQIVNIVHDALYFKIHKDYLWTIDEIRDILTNVNTLPFKVDLKLKVDVSVAENLAENLPNHLKV